MSMSIEIRNKRAQESVFRLTLFVLEQLANTQKLKDFRVIYNTPSYTAINDCNFSNFFSQIV
jgi:hypothetical protein